MAKQSSPSYADVWKYANALQRVSQQARDDFLAAVKEVDFTDHEAAREQLQTIVQGLVDWYGLAAKELGAQWFEYCEELATRANPSQLVGDTGRYSTKSDVDALIDRAASGEIDEQKLVELLQGVVVEQTKRRARNEIEARISEKMQQDGEYYGLTGRRRGGVKYGYARVPVGDTCAYCIMLASRGFDYWTKETAHAAGHKGCNCVIVPFHEASTIPGYEDLLEDYRRQYYDARGLAKNPPPELKDRIDEAKRQHAADYAAGKVTDRWSDENAVTIAMRYNGDEAGFRAETEEREEAAAQAAEQATQPKPKPQTERERLEAQAREVYVRNGGGQGLTEEQANERFDLLVDGNTDAQLRNYIRKHNK